ncbi:MAG: hypothetical protein Q4G49_12650, partial [Paracoccus sp. (in: a-proteobacteria)]|nr:hypothetical protein [Paracoccus sp. (in: a-proteobacteria)]
GAGRYVTGSHNIALGWRAGMGTDATVPLVADRSIAIGQASLAGTDSIAMGSNAIATGEQSTAIGPGNQVAGNHAGALGDPNIVSGDGSYAFGNDNIIEAGNAFVLGNNVTVGPSLDGAVVLGNGSAASTAVSVSQGTIAGVTYAYAGGTVAAGDVVSVGAQGAERQVQNVAAGRIDATSTDAVNGSQLHATNQHLASVQTNLATTTARLPGTWSGANTYNMGQAGGASVKLTNLTAGEISATSTDAVNGAQLHTTNQDIETLKFGAMSAVADIAFTRARLPGDWDTQGSYALARPGATNQPVKVTNLAAGGVSATSTDAVTGAQLHTTNQELISVKAEVADNRDRLPGSWHADGSSNYVLGRKGNDAPAIISNVGPGRVAAGSTEAVTGGQLYDLAVQVGAQGEQITQNRREANGGIASAMALSMVRYDHRPTSCPSVSGLARSRAQPAWPLAQAMSAITRNGDFRGG